MSINCNNCNKEIDSVIINAFNYDGSDSEHRVNFEEYPENAQVITFDESWCGLDLTEKEQMEEIQCPFCKKFPFRQKEVQVHHYIHIVCFN